MKYLITERQYRLLKEEISVDYDEFSIEVDILHDGDKVGYMIMEKEKDDEYTIVDAKIEPDYRGRGLYQKSIMELLEQNPELKINSMFRSEEANFAWRALMKKLPEHIGLREKKYDEGILYQIYMK
jgi:GNAT superfamily N-acetyltransferase